MPEWISVKDRLPKKNDRYLCVLENRVITICSFARNLKKVDKYDFNSNKSGWYDYDSEWGHYEISNVTHWKPLPELPKGEEK